MTFKIPKENVADRLLALIGKKRAIRIPTDAYKKYGPYVYAKTERESFWRALFRPKNQNHPAGMDISELGRTTSRNSCDTKGKEERIMSDLEVQ